MISLNESINAQFNKISKIKLITPILVIVVAKQKNAMQLMEHNKYYLSLILSLES